MVRTDRFKTASWRLMLAAFATVAVGSSAAARRPDTVADASWSRQTPSTPRLRRTINDGWRYAAGPLEGAAAVGYDDGEMAAVDLPHTWNAADAFTDDSGYRRGVGWYRKRLPLEPGLEGKRIFLYFEGANQVAEVHVNGRLAGRHIGGYTAFAFDVTDLVRFDRPNVVAVRVDNRHDPEIPPLNGDFTFYGGIYRDVWLVATDPVHIDLLDHASPGVFIDTPELSGESATVRVRGTVVNATRARKRLEVVSRIVDPRGVEVAVLRARTDVAPGTSAGFAQRSGRIARPLLWSPAEPNLYKVHTEVYDAGRLVDRVEKPLGFRWFDFDARNGFSLNGKPLRLKGTNRHQDRPGYGNALPNEAHREDVRLVKETGFNFLRLAHYPQDPAVLEAADRLGLIVWEEIPVVNLIDMSDAFADNAMRMLVEMIRQHYNHPSVLMWGYMNEVMLVEPKPIPEGYDDRVLELARRLEARVHVEDSTRATVTAISHGEIDNGTGFQDVPDILGLNLYFGWYYHELETLGSFLDSLHARHPDRPLIISEYGAGSDERVHTLEPRPFDFSTEHQQRYHRSQYRQISERAYLLGSAIWNQFDFGSKGRQDTKHGINQKGIFFFDRTPKDIAFYYRARLREEPVLHLATREWTRRAGSRPGDRTQPVVVYTNLEEVELLLTEQSRGTMRIEGHAAEWAVPFRHGPNRLRARGRRGGVVIEDTVTVHYDDRTALFADKAAVEARTLAVNAGGHYQVVDREGVVWEADRPYEQGSWGYVGGKPARTHHRIFGTPDDPLLQATRHGVELYRFDVPDGTYEVRLRFVEIEHDGPDRRIFSVGINDRPAVTDLDLAGRHGRHRAVERTARVQAEGGRGITIRLEARAGESTISGVQLRRLPDADS